MLIKTPVITEKTLSLVNAFNQYTFEVAAEANKTEAAKELSKAFDVTVVNVTTNNRMGKIKPVSPKSRRLTKKSDRKIMVFKLKDGDKIDSFNIE